MLCIRMIEHSVEMLPRWKYSVRESWNNSSDSGRKGDQDGKSEVNIEPLEPACQCIQFVIMNTHQRLTLPIFEFHFSVLDRILLTFVHAASYRALGGCDRYHRLGPHVVVM